MTAEIIKLHSGDVAIECPICGSQLFYVCLEDDCETVSKYECGGVVIDEDGLQRECEYCIELEDEIELELE